MRLTVLQEMKKKIRELEAVATETMQTKKKIERKQKFCESCDNIMWSNINVIKVQKGGEIEKMNK